MGPLDRIRGFFKPEGAPQTEKKRLNKTEEKTMKVGEWGMGPIGLATQAQSQASEVKRLRASVISRKNSDPILRQNLQRKEQDLADLAAKINSVNIRQLPKAAKKQVQIAQKEIADVLGNDPKKLESELKKLMGGVLGKKKFTDADKLKLKRLMDRFEQFEVSGKNVKTDPAIQKQFLKTRDTLGKAVLVMNGYRAPQEAKEFIDALKSKRTAPDFDAQAARFGLDYIIRSTPPHSEAGVAATALWWALRNN